MNRKRLKKSEKCLWDLWGTIKQINIPIVGSPRRKTKRQRNYLKK